MQNLSIADKTTAKIVHLVLVKVTPISTIRELNKIKKMAILKLNGTPFVKIMIMAV